MADRERSDCRFCHRPDETICDECSREVCYSCSYEIVGGGIQCPDCHVAKQETPE